MPQSTNRDPNAHQPVHLWTTAELLATEFPEPCWIVPGLIPTGLVFLAGRPKIGKSWLALQIAHGLGTGGQVLGQPVKGSKVLYIALEDPPRRLKQRCQQQGVPRDANITFATTWPMFIREGGLKELERVICADGFDLAIIDTFSRAIAGTDQMDPVAMTALAARLQGITKAYDKTILVIDHHRKPNGAASDPIDDIFGSVAKGAGCDTGLGLYREQGKRDATLKGRGRDLEDIELALSFDGLTCTWQAVGESGGPRKGSIQEQVYEAACTLAARNQLPTTTNIASLTGQDAGNVNRELQDLVELGRLYRGEKVGREQPYWPCFFVGPQQ